MYQPLDNDTADRVDNGTTYIRSEKSTIGVTVAMPGERDGRRHGRLKPDAGSSASSVTATAAPDEPRARRSFLGIAIQLSTILSFLSLVSLALAFAFISWLWWTPQGDPNRAWRSWVLVPNRLQLSVTVASLVIRTAIATLAASAAAMIASVAVERSGVRLHAVAQVSIARFASKGPVTLAGLALEDSISSFFLRAVLLLLALTTVASQFTSTLLVADFEQSHVISFPRNASAAYCAIPEANGSTDPVLNRQPKNFWLQKPRLSESYAEYTEAGLDVDGIDDTGFTLRAFLPFGSSETREKLQVFQGTTRVVNSRTVCVRPKVSNLTISYVGQLMDLGHKISGTVSIDDPTAAAALGVNPETKSRNFKCDLRLGSYDPRYVWHICSLGLVDWGNALDPLGNINPAARLLLDADHLSKPFLNTPASLMDMVQSYFEFEVADPNGIPFDLRTHNHTDSGPWTQMALDTNAYLDGMEHIMRQGFFMRLNTTLRNTNESLEEGEIQEIKSVLETGRLDEVERLLRLKISSQPATRWMLETPRQLNLAFSNMKNKTEGGVSLKMTVCIDSSRAEPRGEAPARYLDELNHLDILASSTEPRIEPTYVLTPDREDYDVSAARRQLGALSKPASTEDRQILSISPDALLATLAEARNNETYRKRLKETDELLARWVRLSTHNPLTVRFGPAISGLNEISRPNPGHELYSALLGGTINDTESPARALQAVFFSRVRDVYYDFVNLMHARDDCNFTISTFELATVPGRHRGYWAAVGISGTFLVCFAVVCALFNSTRCSLPDNAWHTIAQVSESADVSVLLSRSKTRTDKEVVEISKHLKEDGEEDRFVVRGGVFVRASMSTAAATDEPESEATRTTGLHRRLVARP